MVYSVQQIKFEFLSYIKEFGAECRDWHIGLCPDPEAALFASGRVDRIRDIWLWKPALSPNAAALVHRYFTGLGVAPDPGADGGQCVYLYRRPPVAAAGGREAQDPLAGAGARSG